MILRAIAGLFAGTGALMCIYFGIQKGDGLLVGMGSSILTGMLAFFVGEQNGVRKAK